MLGVDPGAEHVGVSEWIDGRCVTAYELSPLEYVRRLETYLRMQGLQRVFIERFTPKTGFGQANTGTQTQWLIGFTYWACTLENVPMVLVERHDRLGARKRARAAGYRFVAHGHGDHAMDAEATVIAGLRMPSDVLLRNQSAAP